MPTPAVIDLHVRVEVARAVGQEHAGHFGVGAAAVEADADVEPRQRAAELRVAQHEPASSATRASMRSIWKALGTVLLQAIDGEVRAGAEFDVEHGIAEVLVRGIVDVLEQQAAAAARGHAHDDARARERGPAPVVSSVSCSTSVPCWPASMASSTGPGVSAALSAAKRSVPPPARGRSSEPWCAAAGAASVNPARLAGIGAAGAPLTSTRRCGASAGVRLAGRAAGPAAGVNLRASSRRRLV